MLDNNTSSTILTLISFVFILTSVIIIIYRKVRKYGFSVYIIFMLSYFLFYIFLPFVIIMFPNSSNHTTPYNILIFRESVDSIYITMLILYSIFILINILHTLINKKFGKKLFLNSKYVYNSKRIYKIISFMADFFLLISLVSIIIIIYQVGGFSNYLALGSFMRGHISTSAQVIDNRYLPLITLSNVALVPPYLYFVLNKISNTKKNKLLFWISMFSATIYLIYNQGKAPLILFFMPFLFYYIQKRKFSFLKISIILLITFPLLNFLDGFFNYLSYGTYIYNSTGLIDSFTEQYSYPFANFLLRDDLLKHFDYRYFIDYIVWIPRFFPQFVLNLIGMDISHILTIRYLNTEAYYSILNRTPGGGIPVDVVTYFYYQLGFTSILISFIGLISIICFIDNRTIYLTKSNTYRILVYRIIFSVPALLVNSDMSAITNSKLDLFVILAAIMIVNKFSKVSYTEVKYEKNI